MTVRHRAIVFDLFGTLVHFRGRPDPRVDWLRAPFAAVADPARFDAFRAALRQVSMEILAERGEEHREVPSRERFARALARADADVRAADALSAAHMRHLADLTIMPGSHAELLETLGRRYRLAVVSNFDHAPTAHAVLARHGIARHFAAVLISAEFGRRKPHPAIFLEALRRLGVAPDEALHVGDTHADDVVGALAAGLDVAWLGPADALADPPPTHRIADLRALAGIL
ncbi:HAD family hydrolase [bacterium]|nr:HAD family hydrolase [bacterium]